MTERREVYETRDVSYLKWESSLPKVVEDLQRLVDEGWSEWEVFHERGYGDVETRIAVDRKRPETDEERDRRVKTEADRESRRVEYEKLRREFEGPGQ
jgi:hypothetical protein